MLLPGAKIRCKNKMNETTGAKIRENFGTLKRPTPSPHDCVCFFRCDLCAQVLLKNGADPNAADRFGVCPLEYPVKDRNLQVDLTQANVCDMK